MRLRNQRRPFLARQALHDQPRLHGVALSTAPEKECPGVAWIVEDPQRTRVLQPPPQRLALMRAVARPARKWELLIAEGFHGGGGRAAASKRLEERADRLLDLLI